MVLIKNDLNFDFPCIWGLDGKCSSRKGRLGTGRDLSLLSDCVLCVFLTFAHFALIKYFFWILVNCRSLKTSLNYWHFVL